MNEAYQQAKKSDKKILLIFHASWCGWCHKMDSSLNDISCKKYFDDNFVIVHLTVQESKGKEKLENPGAELLLNSYNGKEQGLPYWVILTNDGKLLFDSQIRKTQPDGSLKGSNMGCPAAADEVKAFIEMLREVTKMTDAEVTAVSTRFRKNEN
jgi:thiol-disulfide isomerase/thioredoxin